MKREPGKPYVQVLTEYLWTREELELTIIYGVYGHYQCREDLTIDFPTNRHSWLRNNEDIVKYLKDNFDDLLDINLMLSDSHPSLNVCLRYFDKFPTDEELNSWYHMIPPSYSIEQKRFVALLVDFQEWAGRMIERNEWLKKLNETEEVK
jgi:hypothetical protein